MIKIYINPGHSNTDPGAVGFERERDLIVQVSKYMNDYLVSNYDCQTRMNPGTVGNLYEICRDANNWGADLFVSNHFNAAGGDGYEALVYSENRRKLGEIFEKHVKAIGQNSRGVKIRTGLVVLRDTNMPAVLNEGDFVDNLKDIQDWNEPHELKKLGEAYAKAAAEYLGLGAKKPVVTGTPSTGTDADAKTIWNFLYGKIKNEYGVAGLMGNLYAESALRSNNLEQKYETKYGYTDTTYTAAVDNGSYTNFVNDSAGYGLAQWTYHTRKRSLLEYANSKNKSIGDLTMQLEFLYNEISASYKSVLTDLTNATSVLAASNSVLLKFEQPANQGTTVQSQRASYGQKYYDKFATKKPTTSTTTTTTYSLTDFIKDVQKACGATVDGIAGTQTLSKTVTVSSTKNNRHTVVKAIQKRLLALGYTQVGTADGVAGSMFNTAVKAYQKDNKLTVDGEVTAKGETWKKLLGISATTSTSTTKPTTNTATTYSLTDFIKDVQKACGATVDGIAGTQTLSKTVTVSIINNRKHAVVKAIQKRLLALGYTQVGTADGIAGIKFNIAIRQYQKDNKLVVDGVITAKGQTWKKLLGM